MSTLITVLGWVVALGAILWAMGQATAAQRLVRDEQEAAAEELRIRQRAAAANAASFDAILGAMSEGVVVVNADHTIRHANEAVCQLFGFKGDPTGQSVLSTLRLPLLETMIQATIVDGEPQQEETTLQLVPGKPATHLVISTRPFGHGELAGAVTVIQNISRLRNLEEVRREFVANVSHELRTPLAIFHGYLENLIDRPELPADELRSVLLVMQKHSGRLNALVEDLLTLTRLESRRDPLQRETTDVAAYFASVATDWTPRCGQKGVTLVTTVTDKVPAVSLDPFRFRQVLDNLLDNALKYTPAEGKITLAAARVLNEVIISVTDTGTGIPPMDLPHIFERFYRSDRARSRELGGTGLGLSIVKHLVLAHGGTVSAESEPGQGTTISLTIPLEQRNEVEQKSLELLSA